MTNKNKEELTSCYLSCLKIANEAFCPDEIVDRSIIINEDIDKVLNDIII